MPKDRRVTAIYVGTAIAQNRHGNNLTVIVKNSDCVIALDWLDVGGTINQAFPPGGGKTPVVINVSNDHLIHNGWSMDHQALPTVDLKVLAEPDAVIEALLPFLDGATAEGKWEGVAPASHAMPAPPQLGAPGGVPLPQSPPE